VLFLCSKDESQGQRVCYTITLGRSNQLQAPMNDQYQIRISDRAHIDEMRMDW
jgi:hypothetical protein